jgi:hypothetical protein
MKTAARTLTAFDRSLNLLNEQVERDVQHAQRASPGADGLPHAPPQVSERAAVAAPAPPAAASPVTARAPSFAAPGVSHAVRFVAGGLVALVALAVAVVLGTLAQGGDGAARAGKTAMPATSPKVAHSPPAARPAASVTTVAPASAASAPASASQPAACPPAQDALSLCGIHG